MATVGIRVWISEKVRRHWAALQKVIGRLRLPAVQGRRHATSQVLALSRAGAWDWGGYRSGQTGQTVNLMAYAFVGSNPTPPIRNDEIRMTE